MGIQFHKAFYLRLYFPFQGLIWIFVPQEKPYCEHLPVFICQLWNQHRWKQILLSEFPELLIFVFLAFKCILSPPLIKCLIAQTVSPMFALFAYSQRITVNKCWKSAGRPLVIINCPNISHMTFIHFADKLSTKYCALVQFSIFIVIRI